MIAGPWEAVGGMYVRTSFLDGGHLVCEITPYLPWDERQELARLIAAAPAMMQYVREHAAAGDPRAQAIVDVVG